MKDWFLRNADALLLVEKVVVNEPAGARHVFHDLGGLFDAEAATEETPA